jgi:hypothetical protein
MKMKNMLDDNYGGFQPVLQAEQADYSILGRQIEEATG